MPTKVSTLGSVYTEFWRGTDPAPLLPTQTTVFTAVQPSLAGSAVAAGKLSGRYTSSDWVFFSLPGDCGPSEDCFNHGVWDLREEGSPWCPYYPLPTTYGIESQLVSVEGPAPLSWEPFATFVGLTKAGECTEVLCISGQNRIVCNTNVWSAIPPIRAALQW